MPDLILHRLPFGGRAFEPVTDAGADWLAAITDGATFDVFRSNIWTGSGWIPGDACMAGLESDCVGFQPWDYGDIAGMAAHNGLTMEAA